MIELFIKSFINWRIIKEENSWSYGRKILIICTKILS